MTEIEKLLEVMARLRDPEAGCPWDREQDFSTIAPYTVEEAYEVADAIARDDLPGLRDELGDLLFQVVFHARIAEEAGAFDFHDVARGIAEKMLRRHPHVFGTAEERARGASPDAWERIKAGERERAREGAHRAGGALDGVAIALPALRRAQKLGRRAARVGFDWTEAIGPREKVAEELRELDEARRLGAPARVAEELGDLLFAVVNLARHLGVDAEQALSAANRKFERRFRHMERALRAEGKSLEDLPLEALEVYWRAAKTTRD
ncbi:MAG TPA: nucleoside triphosphate pyrophosphohydrolase [Woeseiaceae bacterium]|nr:nucleoside triphosphate pyrophosphohydrolase [Woeseiaceae bacterium]